MTFPGNFISIRDALSDRYQGQDVALRGWIYRTRSKGKLVFMVVRDSTAVIQATVVRTEVPDSEFEDAKKALVESSVEIFGTLKKDDRAPGGYEVGVKNVRIVSFAEAFPITKDQSEDFLLDNRHLWIRSREMNAYLKIRSTVFNALREYFNINGYHETQSPSFISGACEGGSTLFKVDYFGRPVYLTQSWQLYAEAVIFSLEKIFTIAPSFRAEKSNTRRHLTEFWHCEVEAAWADNNDMMSLGEGMILHTIKKVLENNRSELVTLGRNIEVLENIKGPFPRITYSDAVEIAKKKGLDVSYGQNLGDSDEKIIMEDFSTPVFVTRYPKAIKAFYMEENPENADEVLCHDLLAPEGYGEIIGGSQRVFLPEKVEERLLEAGEDPEVYKWYIDVRRYGAVPHAGYGLGVDRLVAWISGAKHIKDVIPFPRTMRRTTP